ncbi:rCG57804 [Rattus norvegicus]|uniref:RCG57804 n=1 Tax=Rattus norvegicus TaxID=10116 RepID=A6JI51_RAT|nr:rCG57804 [Rattus norvegicus]
MWRIHRGKGSCQQVRAALRAHGERNYKWANPQNLPQATCCQQDSTS